MTDLVYPYLFERIALPKPWAGSRLAGFFPALAQDFPAGTGESIELADLPGASPAVRSGKARGWTLHALLEQFRPQILGASSHSMLPDFPLALKFIDTQEPLSIQVHPCDELDAGGTLKRRGKSEAWLILASEPDAVIYQGLKPGLTRQEFERALKAGLPQEALNARRAKPGDYLLNQAGMIHALGGGLTLLEIQQNSGVTLRFFDWPELGRKGRELQVKAAMAAAQFDAFLPEARRAINSEGVTALQLPGPGVPFGLQSLRVSRPARYLKDWPGFTVFTCLEGACELMARGHGELHPTELRPGDTLLVPAMFGEFEIYPREGSWLVESYAV